MSLFGYVFFWEGLGMENIVYILSPFGIFYSQLVYYMAIWNILQSIGTYYGHWVYFVVIWYVFPRFGIMHQGKSGNRGHGSALSACEGFLFGLRGSRQRFLRIPPAQIILHTVMNSKSHSKCKSSGFLILFFFFGRHFLRFYDYFQLLRSVVEVGQA
jgi:hypothetical protein